MIKETKVTIPINIRNISRYRSLGYSIDFDIKSKNMLEVDINDVSKESKSRITSICDICGSEGSISIAKYWKNWNRNGYNFYSCFGCKSSKREMTSFDRWGVSSFSKTEEFKSKYKETSMIRYGVDSPSKDKGVRDKMKATCLLRHGFENPLIQDKVIEKNRKWMSSDEFKSKSKETIMKKWGVGSFSQTDEFKSIMSEKKDLIVDKIKKTFLLKYGTEYFSSTTEWLVKFKKTHTSREKSKVETCLSRYGVDNVSKVKSIQNKIISTKIKNGYVVPDDKLTSWGCYKRTVRKITNRNKKELYEKWDGFDYYDSEIIKGHFSYTHTHRLYPTIDHKISILHGFLNDIDPTEIGSLDNLCITKKYLNSIKNSLTESDFKNTTQ